MNAAMATPAAHAPTIASVLAAGEPDLPATLGAPLVAAAERAFAASGRPRLSSATRSLAAAELGATAAELARVELGGIIVAGWQRLANVVAAGERTAHTPGPPKAVVLSTNQISASYEPTIELLVDQVTVATLRLAMRVTFEIESLSLIVQTGRIVRVGVGEADVEAELSVEGQRLLAKQVRLDASVMLPIGRGIPIHAAHP